MTKVSVILAVYNVEQYLQRSLESLIKQTINDIEIICIDDCSTDNSFAILKKYAKLDKRIIVGQTEKNRGAAYARNQGLRIANGEYIGFIDPDDAIDLNYYEELYKAAKENNVDVVKCGIKTIYPDGREETGILSDEIKNNNNSYLFNYEWTTAIYRASFIREKNILFPEECKKAQDDVFLSRVIFKHASLKVIDGVYYYYYRREGSLDSSNIPLANIKSALTATSLVLDEINNSGLINTNPELYIKLYERRLCAIFYTLFQNNTEDAKILCADALIKNYNKCKDIQNLKIQFSYPWILKNVEKNDVIKLSKQLAKYNSIKDMRKPLKWYQKLLSIRNDSDGVHKILYLMGIKIRIKKGK